VAPVTAQTPEPHSQPSQARHHTGGEQTDQQLAWRDVERAGAGAETAMLVTIVVTETLAAITSRCQGRTHGNSRHAASSSCQ